MAAAFKPLEKIRAAETDESFAGPREIRHYLGLFLRGGHIGRGFEVIGKAVARQMQQANGVHDLVGIEPGVLVIRSLSRIRNVRVFGWRLGK